MAATEAVRDVDPRARILAVDPLIHIVPDPARPDQRAAAEGYREAQFQGWDLFLGRLWPQAGGRPELIDLLGPNFYPCNEWVYEGPTLPQDHPEYRPLSGLLGELYARYGYPLVIAETGAEGEGRVPWLRYVAREARAAIRKGVPVLGACFYPVTDYPGWADDRPCPIGVLGYPDAEGVRPVYPPLAAALRQEEALMQAVLAEGEGKTPRSTPLCHSPP